MIVPSRHPGRARSAAVWAAADAQVDERTLAILDCVERTLEATEPARRRVAEARAFVASRPNRHPRDRARLRDRAEELHDLLGNDDEFFSHAQCLALAAEVGRLHAQERWLKQTADVAGSTQWGVCDFVEKASLRIPETTREGPPVGCQPADAPTSPQVASVTLVAAPGAPNTGSAPAAAA